MSGGAATNTPPFQGAMPAAQSRPSAKTVLRSNRPSPSVSRSSRTVPSGVLPPAGACRDSRASRRRRDCRRRRTPRRPGSAPSARPRPAPSGTVHGLECLQGFIRRQCRQRLEELRRATGRRCVRRLASIAAASVLEPGVGDAVGRQPAVAADPAAGCLATSGNRRAPGPSRRSSASRCAAICSSIRATRRSSESRS